MNTRDKSILTVLFYLAVSGQFAVANTVDFVKQLEGFSAVPYRDAHGYSIGHGHFIQKGEKFDRITREQAHDLLVSDLRRFEACVDRVIKVELTANQRTALVSFCFNVGEGAFAGSTLARLVNEGKHDAAAKQFARWVYSGGKVNEGLKVRRAKEAAMYMKGCAK